MTLRLRVWLLSVLVLAAAVSGYSALRSIRRGIDSAFPEEVYAQFTVGGNDAEFYLRSRDGYVAVYSGSRGRSPVTVTDIEVAGLRGTDRAMLESGIPVADRQTLLYLLEDLGS